MAVQTQSSAHHQVLIVRDQFDNRVSSTTAHSPRKLPVVDVDIVDCSEDDIPLITRQTKDATPQWRPKFHIMAPHGWMNDPCAPGYDHSAGLYCVNFQWNPHGHVWGNMSWGSATSPNLVDWTISRTPSMAPTSAQDQHGVFTGALLPRSDSTALLFPQRQLTAFYTSAQGFPINHRLPYTRGSEKLAVATSMNSGKTWKRDPQNIILAGPPTGFEVIGWRDPFVGNWEAVDQLIDPDADVRRQYGVLSGGLRGQTPTVFLYRIDPVTNAWTFLSSLVNLGLNYCPSRWTGGDFGVNFEVTNFVTLTDEDGKQRDVLVTSVEGTRDYVEGSGGELSKSHRQMWMSGPLERTSDGIQMKFHFGGALDHGCFYAANGFWDPRTGTFVTFGWIFEDDLPDDLVASQGWSGCLSIPRVVSLKTWKSVVGTTHTHPSQLANFTSTLEQDGTYNVQTVCLTPDPRVQQSRLGVLFAQQPFHDEICSFPKPKSQLELALTFQVLNHARRIGFDILHSSDASQYTRVYFDPSSETVVIDRSRSTNVPGIGIGLRTAPHTLFGFQRDGERMREDLEFRVFFDVSVLEVFVNERVAITTRVYPEGGCCYGIRTYVEDEEWKCGDAVKAEIGKGGARAATEWCKCEIWELGGSVTYVD